MSEKNNDGGLAFPYEEHNGDGTIYRDHFGMMLRDYFAARAPLPPPADFPLDDGMVDTGEIHPGFGMSISKRVRPAETQAAHLARWSFHYADTMLAERAK